jgi:hypothetical protein
MAGYREKFILLLQGCLNFLGFRSPCRLVEITNVSELHAASKTSVRRRKSKVVRVQAMKVLKDNRFTALLVLNLGTRSRCVFNIIPLPLYRQETNPGNH